MSEELKPVEVADEIKAVMEDENFVPSPEDIECYGKHQIKPSEILPCPFCGSAYLQFGDWGTHGAYDKVACGSGCTDWIPVERWNRRPAEEALQKRIAELEDECRRFREALEAIAKFADSEYEKRIPTPSCVAFSTIKRYAEKALKGAGDE